MPFSIQNKMLRTIAVAATTVALCATMAACGSSKGSDSADKALELQFVPTNNDGSMQAKAKPFADYLSKKLGRKVDVTLATDYTTIVEAMSSHKVDIGIMPPAAYVQARDKQAAKAILTSELGAYDRTTGKPVEGKLSGSFKGEVLVRADSDLKKLTDLKGRKIATLSPSSASGYILSLIHI